MDFETVCARVGMGAEKWDAAAAQGCPPDIVPFTVADMEFKTAPVVIEAVKKAADFGLWGYTGIPQGYRDAVLGWVGRRHGWQAQPNWLVGTAGVVAAMYTAVRAFTQPGDGIIVQPPVYPPFFSSVQAAGREVLENPLRLQNGRYVMDLEQLRQLAPKAKMMLFCSPHNPVGRVWQREEVAAVAEICRENDVILFSDEIHCDILMPGQRHTSVGALGEAVLQNSLVAVSASKTFSLAGLPCSSLFIANDKLRKAFKKQMGHDGMGFNSYFGTVAAQAAYEKGEPWMEEMLAVVAGNYAYIKEYIENNIPNVKLMPLEGTYLGWLDFSALGLDAEQRQAFLQQEALLYMNAGERFGTGGAGFERINLACPRSVLQGAMQRLAQAMAKHGWGGQNKSD